jgi:hypothetical protein
LKENVETNVVVVDTVVPVFEFPPFEHYFARLTFINVFHSFFSAIDAHSGAVRCWGSSLDTGRLGPTPRDHTGKELPKPGVSVPFGETHGPFLHVVTGLEHTCALRTDGRVKCWGVGPVSCPIIETERKEGREKKEERRFTRIASGLWHACGVVAGSGGVHCWGRDYAGQVSHAPTEDSGVKFKEISAGEEHTCASVAGEPGEVSSLDAATVLGCASCVGGLKTVVRTQAGAVLCWGNVRAYASSGDMPSDLGKQHMGEDVDVDVARLSKVWIVTRRGPWFVDPSKGREVVPEKPVLVFSPCTVATSSGEEWEAERRVLSERGTYVNNTYPECVCEGTQSMCGRKYDQCVRYGREVCSAYEGDPPKWETTGDATLYAIVAGGVVVLVFLCTHTAEMKMHYKQY